MKPSRDSGRRRRRQAVRHRDIRAEDNQADDNQSSGRVGPVDIIQNETESTDQEQNNCPEPAVGVVELDDGNMSSNDELASSLARKLNCNDHHEASDDDGELPIESGLRNLTLTSGRQQQHLHKLRHLQKRRNNSDPRNPGRGKEDDNNDGSNIYAGSRSNNGFGRQTVRSHFRSGVEFAELGCDNGRDAAGKTSDNDEEQDNTSEQHNCDRLASGGVEIKLTGGAEDDDDDDGQSSRSSDSTIHSDRLSTGYNADESLSPYCVDSDDKSSSTAVSFFGSSDKPPALRPRMRSATTAAAANTIRGKLVGGSDRLDDSGSESESCPSCRRGGVQDQSRLVNDGGFKSFAQIGRNGRDPNNNDNNNNTNISNSDSSFSSSNSKGNGGSHKVCRCNRATNHQYRLGERPGGLGVSSQKKVGHRSSSKCSEFGDWSNIFLWIPAHLRPFFKPSGPIHSSSSTTSATKAAPPVATSAAATALTTPSQLRRRKPRRTTAVEQVNNNLSSDSASDESLDPIEWQKQQRDLLVGDNQGHRPTSIGNNNNMPTNSTNYGSSGRYEPLPGTSTSRRVGIAPARSRLRETSRLYGSNGYLRLGNNFHQKRREPSFFHQLKRLVLLLLIVAVCSIVLWQIYLILIEETNFLGTVKFSPSELGHFNHVAVSTDALPCAKIGKNLLAKGGHAVDAAIGTLICMGIALPNSLGLGGGCLMTIYDNVTKVATVIDGREVAPDYATETMFSHDPISASRGPLSIGVPGELSAYWEAHQRFGRLPWATLFDESIKMARDGFPTVEHLSAALRDMNHAKYIRPELAKIYTNNATGEYFREGEIMHLPQLAKALERIRDNGVKEFYEGETGQMFIDDLRSQGGKMTMENLRQYKALVKPAMVIKLDDDLTVYTQPIPGSGVVLSIILRILKQLGYYKNLKPRNSFESSALYYHHLAEALKHAYAQRAGLEDQADDPARMEKLIANITSDAYIKSCVNKIDDSRTQPSEVYGGLEYFQEDHGTAHTSVMDNEGNSVAITSSVNLYFGSGLVSPRTGITYNDVMDDFTSPNITNKFALPPSKYNRIKPGRRPLSSMAPSIFVDSKGNPKLIIGASGGSKITSSIASVALRSLFFDEDLKTAVDGPRIHHQFLPDEVAYEANFAQEILASLKARGHSVQLITGRSSVVMAIACNYTTSQSSGAPLKHITANSDYRKGGSVDGL